MHVLKVGKARYSLRDPGYSWSYQEKVDKEFPDLDWEAVRDMAKNPEWRLQRRIAEVTSAVKKITGRGRKPTIYPGTREFPRGGQTMTVKDYVEAYFRLNPDLIDVAEDRKTGKPISPPFFQPLSDRCCVIEGEYTETIEE